MFFFFSFLFLFELRLFLPTSSFRLIGSPLCTHKPDYPVFRFRSRPGFRRSFTAISCPCVCVLYRRPGRWCKDFLRATRLTEARALSRSHRRPRLSRTPNSVTDFHRSVAGCWLQQQEQQQLISGAVWFSVRPSWSETRTARYAPARQHEIGLATATVHCSHSSLPCEYRDTARR